MIQNLVNSFMQSPQGQTAFNRLASQGFGAEQATAIMQAAVPTAAQAFHGAQQGGLANARPAGPGGVLDIGNSHYATNFLSGAVSSLLRGEGFMGAAMDGLQGVVGGHVAQVIATRFGLPQRIAGIAGAIVTPLLVDWLWDRVNNGGLDLASLFAGGAGAAAIGGALGGFGGGSAAPQAGWGGPAQPGPASGGQGGLGQGGLGQGGLGQGGLGSLFQSLING